MTDLILRSYREGDWRAMHALDEVCFAEPFRFSRRAMRQFAEAPGALTLLAEQDAQLAGFCIVQIERQPVAREEQQAPIGYVVTLDVAPPWRRKGLARRLMQQIETDAYAAGVRSMELHVFAGNSGALQLYEALGYRHADVAPDFYGKGFDALVYHRLLAP
ncbi:MAG TPA: GNAT family N-acetyltransferase [Acidobacteriaceae bacterium]|nr:GNAT family N-acetyltransferase [Acidobacteriaceae bacterium]